jgi:hypothetical protein
MMANIMCVCVIFHKMVPKGESIELNLEPLFNGQTMEWIYGLTFAQYV